MPVRKTATSLSLLLALPIATAAIGCSSDKKAPESKPATTAPAVDPAVAAAEKAKAAEIAKLTEKFKATRGLISSPTNDVSDEKVALGRMLYYDTRLSKNHDVSCNTCHLLDNYGVDGLPTSDGHKAQKGVRNSPSVYFAAGHLSQFWDGRAADVEEQAKGPVLNPVEMAMPDEASVVKVLTSIPGYAEPFKKAFPEGDAITYDNMAKAIGAFERKLVTPAPWDKFLKGEHSALTDEQYAGLKKFVEVGCQTCHEGAYVGGSQYKKMGAVVAYPDLKDKGRFEATELPEDTYMFKVPSLRNIEKTGPYFHDGSIATLEEAIKLMGTHQLGANISDDDVTKIAAFLKSMTGELRTEYIAMPTLPESGPDTPKPDPS